MFIFVITRPPSSTLFPYTTLFRSTLGKALGGYGAFVAGESATIDWLVQRARTYVFSTALPPVAPAARSEEHTSELQSQSNLVCRLLLVKKNNVLYIFCSSITISIV